MAASARRARWLAASVVLLLGALLGVASVAAVWLRAELRDTDRYVATVAPLAEDPVIQDAVAARLSDEIVTGLDVRGMAQSLVESMQQAGAPQRVEDLVAPLVAAITSFLDEHIDAVVASPRFAQLWAQANWVAHDQVNALLTGESSLVSMQDTAIVVDLGQVLEAVKQRLIDAGFNPAQRIPQQSIPFTLVQSDSLPKLQLATSLLNTAGWLLPVLALAALAGGVLLAPHRRRGLLTAALLLGLLSCLAVAVLALARRMFLAGLPAGVRSPDAAAQVWDILLRFLIDALQTVAVLSAVGLVLCLLAGPSRFAHAIRVGVNGFSDAAAKLLRRTGLGFGELPGFFAHYRDAIRIGVVIAALATLLVWRRPGIAGTLAVTGIALVVLLIANVIARDPGPPPVEAR